jgi:hypothetical protein
MALFLSSDHVLPEFRRAVRSMACALHLSPLAPSSSEASLYQLGFAWFRMFFESCPSLWLGLRIRGSLVVVKKSWVDELAREAEGCDSMHMFGMECACYLPRAIHELSTRFIIPYFLPAIFNKEKPPVPRPTVADKGQWDAPQNFGSPAANFKEGSSKITPQSVRVIRPQEYTKAVKAHPAYIQRKCIIVCYSLFLLRESVRNEKDYSLSISSGPWNRVL